MRASALVAQGKIYVNNHGYVTAYAVTVTGRCHDMLTGFDAATKIMSAKLSTRTQKEWANSCIKRNDYKMSTTYFFAEII